MRSRPEWHQAYVERPLGFKQIAVAYKPQGNDGKLLTAIPFEWSVKGNELKTSISDKLK